MQIKNILITGDDGCNSIGTRVLVYFLKDKYQLKIAATKEQQSGVGGKLSMQEKVKWGIMDVEGVKALWIDGTPCDAVEFAWNYFKEKFDLVISGINLGANVSGGVISSGTYTAAFRALNVGLAGRALALSWNSSPDDWHRNHNGKEELANWLRHPGKTASQVIDLVLKNDFWGCNLLNINLPTKPSREIKFTKPLSRISDFYSCFVEIKEGHYFHPSAMVDKENDPQTDAGAIRNGYISITPCRVDVLKEDVYLKLKDKVFELRD